MANEDKLERLLDQTVLVDPQGSLPLYVQLTRGLRQVIHSRFEDGERFFGEEMLSQRLGVSVSTARRALSDLTSEGLLERHVPRGTFVRKEARGVRGDFMIGVFLSAYDSPFNNTVLERIAALCEERDYELDVFHTRFGEKTVAKFKTITKPRNEQGFVFLTTTESAIWNLYQALTERGYGTVNIDRRIEGYPGTYVGVDNTAGIRLGMAHLFELGHRTMTLLVCEDELHPNVQERVRVFKSFAAEHGLRDARVLVCEQDIRYPAGSTTEQCYDMYVTDGIAEEILRAEPRSTAVLTVSDPGAWVLLHRLAERGVRVPEDISVVGFDDLGYSRLTHPPLTTVAQPFDEIARRAVDLLETPGHVVEKHLLAPTLVIRSSTGPADPHPGPVGVVY